MCTQDDQRSSNGHLPASVPGTNLDALTVPATVPPPAPALEAQAALPDADPCEIAEAAMPDLVFGDLAPTDEAWVRAHTLACRSCASMLHGLEDVCSSLDACNDAVCERLADSRPPAPVALGLPEARYGVMETPVGDVLVAASEDGVCEVSYLSHTDRHESLRELERRGFLVYEKPSTVQPVMDQLREYFAHERHAFTLPLDLTGVTDFTRDVLDATTHIPYGVVRTYGDIASDIGRPRASRAVGNALGRNPVPVIIPCHRVVLSSGAMGWYTGGPEIKRALLGIEGARYGKTRQDARQAGLSITL
jgi:O-6-methylguanine DNA methyltransferase